MAAKLEEVKTYLEKKSIPLVVMFCTDKESIYPEFNPKSIKRGPEPIQLDMITDYLQENTNVDVFNIRQALLAEKGNYFLYDKLSRNYGHYTEIGAFFTYRELMKHINIYFPWMIPYELNDINIDYDETGLTFISIKKEITYNKLDSSFFDGIDLMRPFLWENEIYENKDQDMPVILIIRDSFTQEQFIGKYIAQHFSKSIHIHYLNAKNFEEYIKEYKPDIVVFEAVEGQLGWFAACVAGIPQLQ
jgi:hypothetical protein